MKKIILGLLLILSPSVCKSATQTYIPSTSTYHNYVINIETGTIRQFTCSTCTMTRATISSATIGNLIISTANFNLPLTVSTLTVTSSFTAINANITNQTVTQSTFTSAVINGGSFSVSAGTSTRLNSTSFVTNTATGTTLNFSSGTIGQFTVNAATVTAQLSLSSITNQIVFGGSGPFTKTITAPTPSQNSVLTIPEGGSTSSFLLTNHPGGTQIISSTLAITGMVDISGDSHFKGVTDGSNAVAPDKGYYTESVVNAGATVSAAASGQFGNITSVPLLPGDWDIFGIGSISVGASSVTDAIVVISSFTGNTTTDHVKGDNMNNITNPVASVNDSSGICYWRQSFSNVGTATRTYYLKMKMTYTGTPTLYGKIWARRVR